MRVLITGATGFLGSALTRRLLPDGHTVTAWVRSPERAAKLLGPDVTILSASEGIPALRRATGQADAVVNLAGESIAGGRWSEARKRLLTASRLDTTRDLVEAMTSAAFRPRVFLSASATGIYGDRGGEELAESSISGTDFLAKLSSDWEAAAERASLAGIRTITLRTGIVLGASGGALPKMLLPFRLGLGGRLGAGTQYLPWIHLDDHVEAMLLALTEGRLRGPVNLVSPNPVTNAQFTRALARSLHRPAIFAVPAFALRLALGEMSEVLLGSQRALPKRLLEFGFRFRYETVESALEEVHFPAAG